MLVASEQPQLHFQLEKARKVQGDLTSMDKKFQLMRSQIKSLYTIIFLLLLFNYLGYKNANASKQSWICASVLLLLRVCVYCSHVMLLALPCVGVDAFQGF